MIISLDSIGKLQRISLREVWKHEAYDFTPEKSPDQGTGRNASMG